ncbi:MAG: Cys-Gln thioester bond-forming surface protein [Ignavibacteria bacterium]
MKTITTIVCFLLLSIFSEISSAQCVGGLTDVSINSFGTGQSITFTDPLPPHDAYSGYAGTVNSTMDLHPMEVYCVDLHRNVSLPDNSYTDTCAYVASKLQYILNHYYPYVLSYPGKLGDNNQEAASIQAAIWKYTDNVDANTITDNIIKTRALEILADADLNGNATPPIITFTIEPGTGPDDFFIKTVDAMGNGIAINNIALSISMGSLSTNTVNTNSSGVSPDVTVTGTSSGTITAIANMLYSQGRIVHSTTLTKQSLTIAYPVYGMMEVTEEFGALPVELSSFTGITNGRNAELKWSTTNERNNSGFNIERKISGTNDWSKVGNVAGSGNSDVTKEYSYTDRNLASAKYNYRLKQIDYNGNFEYYDLTSEVQIGAPSKFDLGQNYPNPFNPTTKINYDLSFNGTVSLNVFDMSGKQILAVVNEQQQAGYYSVTINAGSIASGVYYYRLTASGEGKNFVATKKMILVK